MYIFICTVQTHKVLSNLTFFLYFAKKWELGTVID